MMKVPYGHIRTRRGLKRLTPRQMIRRRLRQHNRRLARQHGQRAATPAAGGEA